LGAVEGSRNPGGLFGKLVFVLIRDRNLGTIASGQEAIMEDYHIGPKTVIVAVPTSSMSAYRRISSLVDHFACPDVSRLSIFAVANAYRDWRDLEDEEIEDLLKL
jgi:predicted phosphoribosyltransferase